LNMGIWRIVSVGCL